MNLAADTVHTLFLVCADGSRSMLTAATPVVTAADGTPVAVDGPDQELSLTMGSTYVEAIASFRTEAGGRYRIDAPSTTDGGSASPHIRTSSRATE